MPPPSPKNPIDTLAFEPLNSSDAMAESVKQMAIESEAVREGVESWINSVIRELDDQQRFVFIARLHRTLVGYVILKPREQKISSIWVDKRFRGWGVGQKFYGLGFIHLAVSNPYTAFVPEMLPEFSTLIKTNALVLDDCGPLYVINPGDSETWATKEAVKAREPEVAHHVRDQTTRVVRNKLSAYHA